ncbi:hypothetical protein EHQ42_05685, partial [Leptospira levettii]|uniref:ORC-CDC6 family AAA ATPase n=1 Tax=Leptospira levettii TaxID=2023178 RepID=UPI0011038B1C
MNKLNLLSKNRAEELGYDLWDDFIVPPYFQILDLHIARKPRVILGGRGCGKTMLLRYFSHYTQFSIKRKDIDFDKIEGIGLYWKVDSQYARSMHARNIDNEIWESAFIHYSVLTIGLELIKSIESILNSNVSSSTKDDIRSIKFNNLIAYTKQSFANLIEIKEYITLKKQEFSIWLNQPKTLDAPIFLPKDFLYDLIDCVLKIDSLKSKIIQIYIDEYENLKEYQQILLNTWLKHSEGKLIFNLAVKKNAFRTTSTHSQESITAVHDFTTHDIEKYTLDN